MLFLLNEDIDINVNSIKINLEDLDEDNNENEDKYEYDDDSSEYLQFLYDINENNIETIHIDILNIKIFPRFY